MNDFRKYAIQSVGGTKFDDYFTKLNKKNMTTHLIESNGLSVDIFA